RMASGEEWTSNMGRFLTTLTRSPSVRPGPRRPPRQPPTRLGGATSRVGTRRTPPHGEPPTPPSPLPRRPDRLHERGHSLCHNLLVGDPFVTHRGPPIWQQRPTRHGPIGGRTPESPPTGPIARPLLDESPGRCRG